MLNIDADHKTNITHLKNNKHLSVLKEFEANFDNAKNHFINQNYPQAAKIFLSSYQLAEFLNNKTKKIECVFYQALSQLYSELYSEAFINLDKSLELVNDILLDIISNERLFFVSIKIKIITKMFVLNYITNDLESCYKNLSFCYKVIESYEITAIQSVVLVKELFKSIINRDLIKKNVKKFIIEELEKLEKREELSSNKINRKLNSLMHEIFNFSNIKAWLKYFNGKWISYKYKNNKNVNKLSSRIEHLLEEYLETRTLEPIYSHIEIIINSLSGGGSSGVGGLGTKEYVSPGSLYCFVEEWKKRVDLLIMLFEKMSNIGESSSLKDEKERSQKNLIDVDEDDVNSKVGSTGNTPNPGNYKGLGKMIIKGSSKNDSSNIILPDIRSYSSRKNNVKVEIKNLNYLDKKNNNAVPVKLLEYNKSKAPFDSSLEYPYSGNSGNGNSDQTQISLTKKQMYDNVKEDLENDKIKPTFFSPNGRKLSLLDLNDIFGKLNNNEESHKV